MTTLLRALLPALCAGLALLPAQTGAPDQIHLAWVEDAATTTTVVWRTVDTAPSSVEYRAAGANSWQRVAARARTSGTAGQLWEATIRGLTPSSRYEYRVGGGSNPWSATHAFRTAPKPGDKASYEFVFVADTGMVGRADGLETGTKEIIAEVAKTDPTVILWGGDAAYYNTDKRFGTLEQTIDAWFNQVAPFAVKAAMMPTYGNHEIFLQEGYEPWAARNPTPEGFDNRKFYSFDVGDIHFVSILGAQSERGSLPEAALRWLDEDMARARRAGRKWIIPYLHVAPFSDGSNHPSNLEYRAQLGPLFEKHGVRLVFTCHDQSYERTWPLKGVPDRIDVTSQSKSCYGDKDGTVYLKVGPGGKQSNINKSFATFKTNPPPFYTAHRNNTAHHFARMFVDPDGINVHILAVRRGEATRLIDHFRYAAGACPAN